MSPKNDRLYLAADQELQMATLRAGWRFYERAAERDDAQQALAEWVEGMKAVLDLGVEPSVLVSFKECLTTALNAATAENLKQEIQTLVAAVEPAPLRDLGDALVSVRALIEKKSKKAHPVERVAVDDDGVATDTGIDRRSAARVSSQLRAA